MKKELTFEKLTLEQKIGMLLTAHADPYYGEEDFSYILELIRKHCLGSVWISPLSTDFSERMTAIQNAADYPLLIFTDAEAGFDPYLIGRQNALACANREDLAYAFGKVTGVTARKLGYSVICDPILDMTNENVSCGGTVRCMGANPERVTALAAAQARGFHDAGILTVAKHYPGISSVIDTHMAESNSMLTEEELMNYNLKPYLSLIQDKLIDGVMTTHARLGRIDPQYPASLSKKITDLLRCQGFDGFYITDALCMMGVVSKFGAQACKGLAIAGGNDFALAFGPNKVSYEALTDAYKEGIITEERLNDAVHHVLDAQKRSMDLPKNAEVTADDLEMFRKINTDCIYAEVDAEYPVALDVQKRHFFMIMTENASDLPEDGRLAVDTRERLWYQPEKIATRLKEYFPNSACFFIPHFPNATQNMEALNAQLDYDDVILITFFQSQAYIGQECFTSRILSLAEALQITNRISTVLHFGNPFILEDLPHIPRRLIGCMSFDCTMNSIEVLRGAYPALGTMTYPVRFR